MLFRKNEKTPDEFWREYEEKIGEKVLARSLGRYVSGWEEFDAKGWTSIWGLIIASSGGFRFHHFPQASWLDILSRSSSSDAQKEKTIFIPKESIISSKLIEETKWWKKILNFSPPHLLVAYRDLAGKELQLLLETDFNFGDVAEVLSSYAES